MPERVPPEVAVLIPCYNAGERIAGVVDRALAVADRVLVVNDGSTDGCIEGLQTPFRPLTPGSPFMLDEKGLYVLTFPENRGKGAALLAGFAAALSCKLTCVAVIDADGQHAPEELPRLYDVFQREQAGLLVGSRTFDRHRVPLRSWLGNRLTAFISTVLLGQRVSDTQSGYRLHSRAFLESVIATVPAGRYETEMTILVKAAREGFRVACAPIETIYETGNASSHFSPLADSFRIYRTLLGAVLRSRKR